MILEQQKRQIEPSEILNFSKEAGKYIIDEALPFSPKALGLATFTFGKNIEAATIAARSFNALSKTGKGWRSLTAIKNTENLAKTLKFSGNCLKVLGRLVNIVGNISMVWDVMSADSPEQIDDDRIIENTKRSLSNYLNNK